MKRLFFSLACALLLVGGGTRILPERGGAQSPDATVNVYFFWGTGCPHCERQKPFLASLEERYDEVNVHALEIWSSRENRDLLTRAARALQANLTGVPVTIVGERSVIGFLSAETTGRTIEDAVIDCLQYGCTDIVGSLLAPPHAEENDPAIIAPDTDPPSRPAQPDNADSDDGEDGDGEEAVDETGEREEESPEEEEDTLHVSLPFIGTIDVMRYSLPAITIIIAGLDGFNPCAMWTLIFLLGLLVGMKSRWRRWTLGTAFIITSAAIYFLFMAAWLNLILFLGFLWWIRTGIGLVALTGGAYYLKEYVTNKDGTCKVTGGERRRRIFRRIQDITHKRSFLLALIGIILLAIAVNMVEAICSAGLPAVYAQVLALNELTMAQYYGYLLLYVLIFLLDDLFIFFTAMFTMEVTGMTSKYARYSHLIGGVLMIILGLLLLFKPEWLMFG
jgi:thiol-disulfide isomerase/thioredoxin